MINAALDEALIRQYLADSPPSVVPLAVKPHFEALNDQEKLYAHYISVYGISRNIYHQS
jgi:dipeptidyl-peptidase-3